MSNDVPVTNGQGQSSVAAEEIASRKYQLIKVVGGETGSTSVMGVNPDRSISVSVIGTISATFAGNASISGAVTIAGSVLLGSSNASVITVWQSSSVIAVPTGNQSVSGAINVSGSVLLGSSNASVISVFQSSSILAVPVGSVITVWKDSSIIGIVTGSVVAVPTGNQSISGAINVSGSVLLGSSNASVITRWQDSSILAVPVGSVITVFQSSSIIAIVTGSVTAAGNQSVSGALNISGSVLLGSSNASVITVWKDSSVLAVPVGSVITIWQSPSIVGTYAEDAASATGDKGLLVMGARNDTLSSVTSADGDYSSHVVGPAGELIAENAPLTKWVSGTADLRGAATLGASAIAIATGGTSVFTYITGVQVANMGSASVLVTFASGGSILGYTIAPAGGGSNIYYQNGLKTPANFGFAASISGVASVLVSAQGFISKT